MQIYGIIGYPLGHSCSPRYFNEKFQKENIAAEYRSFEMPDIRQLSTLLQQTPDLCGFNVTIPHKQNILPFLDEISEEARVIGAVNCVKVSIRTGTPIWWDIIRICMVFGKLCWNLFPQLFPKH